MKIAMFGIKGLPVPAGAEVVVEEVGSRLAARGHEVLVYVRPHYTARDQKTWRGMRLAHLPSITSKNLDAISHSLLASLAVLGERPDVVHIHSTGNSVFALHPSLLGMPSVVTSHGLDWQRAKWGRLARAYLRMTDYTSTHFPTATTAVSRKIQRYYQEKYQREAAYIPNGVNPPEKAAADEIKHLGLQGRDYILFAARLVPEKGAHLLLEAYQRLKEPALKLVIAGDGIFGDGYAQELKRQAGANILFPGFVSGRLKRELLSNAYMFVLPSEIEGLSTGLMEAMSYGNCVLTSDIEENLEVVEEEGVTFQSGSAEDLYEKMAGLINTPQVAADYGSRAAHAILHRYDWETVTQAYEALYKRIIDKK